MNGPAGELAATVAICTMNRAESLRRALDSLVAAASQVDVPWELLVVDNGSRDHTPDVVESFAGRLPVRRVVAPVPGLSNARNVAIDNARGPYLVWTDDDVVVDQGWLAAYFEAFRAQPQAAIYGGRATPVYEEPVNRWFVAQQPYLEGLLAMRDHPEWLEIVPGRTPFGLNYAVRAVEQRRHRYDPDLGVAPGRRRGGEETAVLNAILAEGGRGVWVWSAQVHHLIPPARQTMDYIMDYYRSLGQELPLVGTDAPGLRIGGVPLKLYGKLARSWLGVRLRKLTGRPSWMTSQVNLAKGLGTLQRFRDEARP